MKRIPLFLLIIFITKQSSSQLPQPINLNIQNQLQEQTAWCWAAVSQEIIYWLTNQAPSQCELVAVAKTYNANICCQYPANCNVPGDLQNIQLLIARFGGHYSSIAQPANPLVLYNTLCQGRAIILFLQTTPYIGHFVVLNGMSWDSSPYGALPSFYINDPMSYFTVPISFAQLIAVWRAAIVVY